MHLGIFKYGYNNFENIYIKSYIVYRNIEKNEFFLIQKIINSFYMHSNSNPRSYHILIPNNFLDIHFPTTQNKQIHHHLGHISNYKKNSL